MNVPRGIIDLVERFERNREVYQSGKYNETQLRREFIDPFYKELGWDVENTAGHAEAYKDVIHEDAIKIGSATKAPDYCFRIGGTRKFFVEAKKPSVNLAEDVGPAYQLRRYAWSAKLALSILTDFEEFAVYDCRIRPDKSDKASTARIMYLKYTEYPARWAEIAGVFSKDAILKGSFDRYSDVSGLKKGTAGVDAAFLREIETWREKLARNIAMRNPRLTQRELNAAVTATINRIIFLRICEDRGIEMYGQLLALKNGANIYERLIRIYYAADEKYNSGLFHFRAEKDRPISPDTLTLNLAIDDKTLKDIFSGLYYPDSPYEFSVLPADILGQVYEQFLGKVIHLSAGHRAKVEDKPEVKKAGGVYYTPTYIVDYIVRNTLGETLKPANTDVDSGRIGKSRVTTPRQAAGIRILDPACGSGSFLLGAYQHLLDWHLNWYRDNDPEKWMKGRTPLLFQAPGGDLRLTTAERKRILLNNIYGVDIDPQAVEVTKLSLLLKVLEGENEQSLSNQLRLFRERALPDLADNIKCGNSLIGPDFYDSKQAGFFDDEERYRINVFDWNREFPGIMKAGGFDVVIGNPPYIRIQTMKQWAPLEAEHYKTTYAAAGKGNYDIYVVFVERGLHLLNDNGRLGFILPHKFFNARYGEPLRGILAKGGHLSEVVHFGDNQVFAGATTYTCLLFLDKARSKECRITKVKEMDQWRISGNEDSGTIPASGITASEWNFTVGRGADLFEKLRRMPVKLGDMAHLFVGLQTDADDVYIVELDHIDSDITYCRSTFTGEVHPFETRHLKNFVKGSVNIRRYHLSDLTKRLIFPYQTLGDISVLISPTEYACQFPFTWDYLLKCKAKLANRNMGKMSRVDWYGYVYRKNHSRLDSRKLLVPSLAFGATFAPDLEGKYFFVGSGGGGGGGYGISLKAEEDSVYLYMLGVLNSRLSTYILKQVSTSFRGGYIALNKQYIEQLPIRTIDFNDPSDAERHDRMAVLAEQMLSLHKKLAAARADHDRTSLQRQIEATDTQIDRLVYELYELTDEEIRIVEDAE